MLKSRIPEIAAELDPRVQATIHHGVQQMADKASRDAPDAPPAYQGLPASIEAKERGPSSWGIYAAWYWFFPEFGTRSQAAQPYMIPAVESEMPKLLAELRTTLRHL
jgi:HK97 gp10 family phage protein